jgi:hypothetical protein
MRHPADNTVIRAASLFSEADVFIFIWQLGHCSCYELRLVLGELSLRGEPHAARERAHPGPCASFRPTVAGANVSAIARSNGLDPSQLFAWRRKAKTSGVVAPLAAAANKPVKFARFDAMRSDMVDIMIGDAVVRAGGEADWLADVIRAVRKA